MNMFAVLAHSFMLIDDLAAVAEFNDERNDYKQPREHDEDETGRNNIKSTLYKAVDIPLFSLILRARGRL